MNTIKAQFTNTCHWQNPDDYCFNIKEGKTDYCARHNRLMRKAEEQAKKDAEKLALKLSKKPAPRSKPSKVSDKRKVQNAKYLKVRAEYLMDHGTCQAKIENVCYTHAIEIHHSAGRSGDLLTDKKYFLAVCRGCHDYIHQHPLDALKRGLSISRLATNQTI